MYDGRINSLNPDPSFYANLVLRTNLKALHSDNTYERILLDVRKYLYFPSRSASTLALWVFGAFTVGSDPPYLDLPFTGGDLYEASGRGYIQGRFRGRNFLYQDAEYRFPFTRNRLLGGVLFVNNQLATAPLSQRLGAFAPGFGAGLRLMANKFSRLNIAIDYGFGLHGSQGFFFNFGEFF